MKRKRDRLDRLEKDSLLRKALPTASTESPTSIPLDGFQYLAMVQKEASKIPDVLVAHINVTEHPERLHDALNIPSLQSSAHISKTWFNAFIQNYKLLKMKLLKIQNKKIMLDLKTEAAWKKVLYTDQSLEPTTSVLSKINHTLALKLVKYHCFWIQKDFSILKCQWLFCLLLIVDPLLTADQICILRNLARNLLVCTPKSNSENAGIQMILSIISGIFGQKDFIQI
jgi:hypothetical protein